jgi:glycosyltransferase involved in cell wall biosynthesis
MMPSKKLSILVPTLEARANLLTRLMSILSPQITDAVEVLTELDDGTRSIGEKRNALLDRASGEYICFVDDDDIVSSDYVDRILKATASRPDCVGMHLLHFVDGKLNGFTYHSIRYRGWHQAVDESTGYMRFYRCPNHLNPVRRKHALKSRFPEVSYGEDRIYSFNLRKHLVTEEYILEPIYYYYFSTEPH